MSAVEEQRHAQTPPKPSVAESDRSLSRILMAVWVAILLGIGVQLLVLASRTVAGAPFPGLNWLPELLNGVTWAVFVCAGVVLGTLASRARTAVMGLLGFISAPLAFSLAKGLQRGLQSMMDAPVDKITPALYTLAGVKAVEYACLGASLGWLLSRGAIQAWRFAGLGLAVGLVFGAVNVLIMATQTPAKLPALVGASVNELVFPVGCALVIYLAVTAGRRLTRLAPGTAAVEHETEGHAGMPLA
jgi:hypothetical protein